jgi:hypothetical protein
MTQAQRGRLVARLLEQFPHLAELAPSPRLLPEVVEPDGDEPAG